VTITRLRLLSLLGAIASAGAAMLVLVPSSPAADESKPSPCPSMNATDPTGDAGTGGDSLDLVGGFIKNNADSGETTANWVLKKLDKTIPAGATGKRYRLTYSASNGSNYLQVVVNTDGEVFYQYNGTGGFLNGTGAFFEGENGIAQMVMPSNIGGDEGSKLTGLSWSTTDIQGVPNTAQPSAVTYDTMPGKDQTVTACSPGGQPAPTQPQQTQPTQTQPPAQNPPAQNPPPEQPRTQSNDTRPAPLQIRFSRFGGSAKRLSAAKVLKLKVRSLGGPISKLQATLRLGSPKGAVYGKGALAKLNGKGTLPIRLTKKLKKGTYVLVVTGRQTSGRAAMASTKLRFS
jgi:hypothetical protein